ncbi:MAG TPA: D-alanine--D-alanine ligase family protein [Bacteroidia bacterium]|nr:D-alanine--D-alanine ligase family protein [Bacteroidia bacterium]HRS58290.1 D-alanine--D-alanine ligase family protein [Bacteroidia bacterium]HRU69182.1 D-alanine--D-alanine ligase family protein [Bacteroidia bacterium]
MVKNVGIIFGGKSTEHEISIISAGNVFKNLDRQKYCPVLIYIDKNGQWFLANEDTLQSGKPTTSDLKKLVLHMDGKGLAIINGNHQNLDLAAVFPVLHGPNGEDGSVQGLFETAGIPYVGPGIAGSANAMDKEISKKLFRQSGLDVANYVCLLRHENFILKEIIDYLGLPLVVKPSRAGSSVGISKAKDENELEKAINLAFEYDNKILVEEYIKGREIEVAILGNEEPVASVAGEIITEFYDYREKYSKESKTKLEAPARIDDKTMEKVKNIAIRAFRALDCEGMSRVDFFLTPDRLLVNEINTIPGFTNISMYPRLFELSGIPQKELISKLIELAISRYETKNRLKTFYEDAIDL